MIVDLKSGPGADHGQRLASYSPQLSAYSIPIDDLGGKQVLGVSVFWTNNGELSVADFR